MKSKDILSFLINPFTRIAGLKAFFIGIIMVLFMGLIGTLSGVYFDGVFDIHIGYRFDFVNAYTFLFIGLFSLIVIMWIAGLLFSKDFRFVDILGTMTLSKAPFIFPAFLGFMVDSESVASIMQNPLSLIIPTRMIIFILLCMPFIVWYIALMYNAFKVSFNIKGTKNVAVFITALLLAEILSQILILLFIKYI